MTDSITASGQCLCKKVTIHATQFAPHVDACHCEMCRKWSGSALLAVDCGSKVTFEGQQHISCFNSSEWAERGFCKHCGTHLFYKLLIIKNLQTVKPTYFTDYQQTNLFRKQEQQPLFPYCSTYNPLRMKDLQGFVNNVNNETMNSI